MENEIRKRLRGWEIVLQKTISVVVQGWENAYGKAFP